MKQINKRGFATVELIIVLIIIVVVGAIAWSVGKHSAKTPTAATSGDQVQSQTPIGSIKGWKTFVDRRDRIFFQYPADWKVDVKKTDYQANDIKGDMLSGTVKSPSGKADIIYGNFEAGVGDPGCNVPGEPPAQEEPQLLDCPVINILEVEDLPGFEATHMKYIEKISHWKSDTDFYIPSFGLTVDTADFPLKVGTLSGQSDTFMRTNFTQDAGIFAHNWTIDRHPEDGYASYQQAKDYLNSDEVKTAKKIILSTSKY